MFDDTGYLINRLFDFDCHFERSEKYHYSFQIYNGLWRNISMQFSLYCFTLRTKT